jgi:hypothetical protein
MKRRKEIIKLESTRAPATILVTVVTNITDRYDISPCHYYHQHPRQTDLDLRNRLAGEEGFVHNAMTV